MNTYIQQNGTSGSSYQEIIYDKALAQLKYGIWIYCFFLLFEGALRKWVIPSLSTPLLVIRDPIAIWLIFRSCQLRIVKYNSYMSLMTAIGLLSMVFAIFLGHGNIGVAIFGVRILVVYFPLIFVIGRILDRNDIVNIGKAMLVLTVFMTILIGLQFYSPQSAWVNRGIGGDSEGGGFSGANGYFRPPGTFSFISGTVMFYGLAIPYILYFWNNQHLVKRFWLIAATVAYVFAIPLSISRTLSFETGISVLFFLWALCRNPKNIIYVVLGVVGVLILLVLFMNLKSFSTATDAFTTRFTTANTVEGGVKGVFLDRFLGGLIGGIFDGEDLPFWGHGIGMGTNVGAMLLSGKNVFLISEAEWGRLVGEMGLLLGLSVITLRVAFCFSFIKASYQKMRQNDLLPWMLSSFGFLLIMQGQVAQPTVLGFSAIVGGLILASLKGENN